MSEIFNVTEYGIHGSICFANWSLGQDSSVGQPGGILWRSDQQVVSKVS